MRRLILLLLFVLAALPARAQIGRQPLVRAGTPEDRALLEIDAATDPARRLALLNTFLAEFGQGGRHELALLAYERFIAHYLGERNYEKAFEYGDRAFQLDPDNLTIAVLLVRAAQEKGDVAQVFDGGDRVGAILQRFKAAPPPAGVDPATWPERKAMALDQANDQIQYVYSALFTLAYQTPDAARRAALLERYANAFPDSPHAANAQALVAAAYQQAQNYPKMLAFAERILERDPNHISMLILLADYGSEKGEQLDKAEAYATRALALLGQQTKPEALPADEWQRQQALQQGLAQSALGQIHLQRGRNPQAVDALRAAGPLLKPDPVTYGRNQYRLAFALLNLKRTAEARTVLQEAATINSPYRALAQQKLSEIRAGRPATKRP